MAAVAISRKRAAPDDGAGAMAPAANKRAPYGRLRSIREYEKLEVLGKGSYGVVVKARDRRTGETVAVKSNRLGSADDLIREAGFLADCLGHPSVVQIRGIAAAASTAAEDDFDAGRLFLVMEFAGPSLRTVLKRRRRFSEAEARRIMRHLLGAAEKLHGAGIIHRDIKPANILVGPGGAAKLCDFGAAAPAMPAGMPYPEESVGTLLYRSPEQLRGSRCYGPAVDMWALGCVMWELLAGEALFGEAYTDEEVLIMAGNLRDHIVYAGSEAFGSLPEPLSPSAGKVFCGLLCYDHDQRFTAAEALKQRWFTEGDEAGECEDEEHPSTAPLLSVAS